MIIILNFFQSAVALRKETSLKYQKMLPVILQKMTRILSTLIRLLSFGARIYDLRLVNEIGFGYNIPAEIISKAPFEIFSAFSLFREKGLFG
jgi:hypothetical protein